MWGGGLERLLVDEGLELLMWGGGLERLLVGEGLELLVWDGGWKRRLRAAWRGAWQG